MTRSKLREQMFRLCFSIDFHTSEEFEAQADLYFSNNDFFRNKEKVSYAPHGHKDKDSRYAFPS